MKFPNIDPTAFNLFGFEIKWYGISYACSLLLALTLCKILSNKYKLIEQKIFDDLFIWVAIGIILGGRLGYVMFYNFNFYFNNPKLILLGIRDGGMSFHGGIIGITISCFLFAKLKNISFLKIMDIIACAAPIGLFFGNIIGLVLIYFVRYL